MSKPVPSRRMPRKTTRAKLKDLMQSPTIFETPRVTLALPESPSVADPVADRPYGGQPYLPTDYKERKEIPICSGVLDYFPLALLEVAKVSKAGNDQHNPGQPLHWARGKSMDQMDTTIRHIMERGNLDTDGAMHLAKAAWRILAELQIECEKRYGLPISRGSWEAGRES